MWLPVIIFIFKKGIYEGEKHLSHARALSPFPPVFMKTSLPLLISGMSGVLHSCMC